MAEIHYHDVAKSIEFLNALVEKDHSVIVIELNMDIIRSLIG